MKFKPDKKYIQISMTIFFTSVAIMLVYFLFFRIEEIKAWFSSINKTLAPIFCGLIFAYLMTPLLNSIEKKLIKPLFDKRKWMVSNPKRGAHIRRISVVITFAIVLLFFYLFFYAVIPQLYGSILNLVSQYNTYTNNIINWINDTLNDNPDIADLLSKTIADYSDEADDYLNGIVLPAIQSFISPNLNNIFSSISQSIVKLFTAIWNIIIGLIISLYVLCSKEKFAQGSSRLCYAILETSSANKFIESVRFTHRTFIGFLSGKVVDSLIIGILCYIGCLIMKMPYTVLVSVIVGVTNVIPFFGPYIGAIPSIFIILLVDPKQALIFTIFIIVLQQFDGNFLGPMILSQSTGLTGFWIIFAITLFGGLFGVFGMVIGVPVTAVIFAGIENITAGRLKKKNLPVEPENYYEVGSVSPEGEFIHYEHEKPEKKEINKDSKFYKAFTKLLSKLKGFFTGIVSKFKKK